jgi:hypothetical protein
LRNLRAADATTENDLALCNLYSITKNQDAIRRLFRVAHDSAGNLPPMSGVFPTTPRPWCAMPPASAG